MLLLSACESGPGWLHHTHDAGSGHVQVVPEGVVAPERLEPIIIRASGYGTYEHASDARSQRKRLLAMRASKLDAYRALAERIYGTSITGSSSVNDLVLQHDSFRTLVDSVVRGARVLSTTELSGGGYETLMEVSLDGRFQRCLTSLNYFRYDADCRLPMPSADSGLTSYSAVSVPSANWRSDDRSSQVEADLPIQAQIAQEPEAVRSIRPATAEGRKRLIESARKGSGLYAPANDRPQGE
ncbi:hypothetical protein GCM10022278_34230 [Allohahella marinimesophila]|uniref:Lipoprotein LPP20-like domain-containing protein n=2 Tax=Allohahella marinimesophila TaxID=1054972 RepID=A0ABP7Q1J2_9GAMM